MFVQQVAQMDFIKLYFKIRICVYNVIQIVPLVQQLAQIVQNVLKIFIDMEANV